MSNYNFPGANQFKDRPKYLGLKKDTYIAVLILATFAVIVAVIGRHFKLQEDLTAHFYNKSTVYAQTIKTLTSYKKPTIDLIGKAKATLIIKQVWRSDYKVGMALAGCESGFREKVVNSIGATGYFQINAPVHQVPVEEMQNGYANAGFAYSLYKEQGLTPWVSSKDCWQDQIAY